MLERSNVMASKKYVVLTVIDVENVIASGPKSGTEYTVICPSKSTAQAVLYDHARKNWDAEAWGEKPESNNKVIKLYFASENGDDTVKMPNGTEFTPSAEYTMVNRVFIDEETAKKDMEVTNKRQQKSAKEKTTGKNNVGARE
jgi:hypothetical protein